MATISHELGPSQLPISSLDDLRFVLRALWLRLASVPTQRAESLGQDGVREVIAGVQPVGIHGAEVLHLQLDKRSGEFGRVAEFDGKGV